MISLEPILYKNDSTRQNYCTKHNGVELLLELNRIHEQTNVPTMQGWLLGGREAKNAITSEYLDDMRSDEQGKEMSQLTTIFNTQ